MNAAKAGELLGRLDPAALVIDIGGGAAPFSRADYVIDGLTYEERGKLAAGRSPAPERFGPGTWVRLDLCDRQPWPFDDRFFDFAVCSHVLEDVRDPIWVCSEMRRIAKAGYIEIPSRVVEQSLGVEHPLYAGFYHHRWLVTVSGMKIQFRHKPHSLHSSAKALVADVGPWRRISPKYESISFEWQGDFQFEEVLPFDEGMENRELCVFAESCRSLPDLTVPLELPVWAKVKRWVYYRRLRRAAISRWAG